MFLICASKLYGTNFQLKEHSNVSHVLSEKLQILVNIEIILASVERAPSVSAEGLQNGLEDFPEALVSPRVRAGPTRAFEDSRGSTLGLLLDRTKRRSRDPAQPGPRLPYNAVVAGPWRLNRCSTIRSGQELINVVLSEAGISASVNSVRLGPSCRPS